MKFKMFFDQTNTGYDLFLQGFSLNLSAHVSSGNGQIANHEAGLLS